MGNQLYESLPSHEVYTYGSCNLHFCDHSKSITAAVQIAATCIGPTLRHWFVHMVPASDSCRIVSLLAILCASTSGRVGAAEECFIQGSECSG